MTKKKSLYLNVLEIIFYTVYYLCVKHSGLQIGGLYCKLSVLNAYYQKCLMWLRVYCYFSSCYNMYIETV
jgi:hypothetical protein